MRWANRLAKPAEGGRLAQGSPDPAKGMLDSTLGSQQLATSGGIGRTKVCEVVGGRRQAEPASALLPATTAAGPVTGGGLGEEVGGVAALPLSRHEGRGLSNFFSYYI